MVAGAVPDPVTDLCLIVAYILPLFPRLTSPTGPPPSPLTGACLAHPALRPLSRGPLPVLHAGVFGVFWGPCSALLKRPRPALQFVRTVLTNCPSACRLSRQSCRRRKGVGASGMLFNIPEAGPPPPSPPCPTCGSPSPPVASPPRC